MPTWIALLIEREYAAALRTALEVKQMIDAAHAAHAAHAARAKFDGL